MAWAEGIAHRKKVGGKWEGRLARREVVAAVLPCPVREYDAEQRLEVAKAV